MSQPTYLSQCSMAQGGVTSESDPRASLSHVLSTGDSAATPVRQTPKKEEEAEKTPHPPVSTSRKGGNGNTSSMYAGNRIKYLKKKDGEPLWRKDLQFNFLCHIFKNEQRVFTMASDGSKDHTFAEIYIDAMAKSSKCSQVLKEKLTTDKAAAVDMAIICLLVNVGRMNTTLNFFPEMRARVRTYHPIPCLQHQSGTNVSKQLQDGPRLKSILKGATEDTPQPSTIEALEAAPKPRGNPVNLLFALSQYAPKISEKHMPAPREFFDLFVRTTISSESRARAFLWLVWWYLESNFTAEDALNNPFGPGQTGPDSALPVKVPPLDSITETQADQENVDTDDEIKYGEEKKKEREMILTTEPTSSRSVKRGGKNSGLAFQGTRHSPFSDSEGVSPPPLPNHLHNEGSVHDLSSAPGTPGGFTAANHASGSRTKNHMGDDSNPNGTPVRGRGHQLGRGTFPKKTKDTATELAQTSSYPAIAPNQPPVYSFPLERPLSPVLGTSQANPGSSSSQPLDPSSMQLQWDSLPNASESSKPRRAGRSALTTDQQRRQRIEELLFKQMNGMQQDKKAARYRRGVILDSMIKTANLPDGYDSEEDSLQRRGGIDEVGSKISSNGHDDDRAGSDIENVTPLGDAGANAAKLAEAFRAVGRLLDGIKTVRPRGIHPPQQLPDTPEIPASRTPGSTSRPAQQGASPAPSATSHHPVPAGRMAADDPRRKRPYKPRAKRGEGLRNPANRHLLQQQRDARRGHGTPPATASEIAGGRRHAFGGSRAANGGAGGGGSVKRKRGQGKADSGGNGPVRASRGTPMDMWADNEEDREDGRGTKRIRAALLDDMDGGGDDTTEVAEDSMIAPEDEDERDLDEELLEDGDEDDDDEDDDDEDVDDEEDVDVDDDEEVEGSGDEMERDGDITMDDADDGPAAPVVGGSGGYGGEESTVGTPAAEVVRAA